MMNWEEFGSSHGQILRYYPATNLDGLRKTTRKLTQDSQSQGQDLNLGPPKYKA
jgi:hypothetical protein